LGGSKRYASAGIESAAPADAGAAKGDSGSRRGPRVESAVLWKLGKDGELVPVKIALGITDHTFTELTHLLRGTLAPGDDVVTSSVAPKSLPPGSPGIRR